MTALNYGEVSSTGEFVASTADDEQNYFTGEQPQFHAPDYGAIVAPGIYRLVGGMLQRVESSASDAAIDTPRVPGTSGITE